MKQLKALFFRYKEQILYLFFGGCTTLINIVSYWLLTRLLSLPTTAATALAWAISVLFAYLTNRTWVFESREHTLAGIAREAVGFFAARLATGLMDTGLMAWLVDGLRWPDMPVKLGVNVLVIILNYVFSKWLIFRKKRGGRGS